MTRKSEARPKKVAQGTSGLGRRILRARIELADAGYRKPSQTDLGVLVGRYLGLPKGVTAATVSRWEADQTVPDIETVGAIAAVCNVDPGWLAFGERSRAPGPDSGSSKSELDDEINRWKRARVAIMLSEARQEEVALWQKKKGREWTTQFNRYERDIRAAWRIKDPAKRDERRRALEIELARLVEVLNELTAEATLRYRDAMSIEEP